MLTPEELEATYVPPTEEEEQQREMEVYEPSDEEQLLFEAADLLRRVGTLLNYLADKNYAPGITNKGRKTLVAQADAIEDLTDRIDQLLEENMNPDEAEGAV